MTKKQHGNTSEFGIVAAKMVIDSRDNGGDLTPYAVSKRLRGTNHYASRPTVIAALRRLGRGDLVGDMPQTLKQYFNQKNR